MNLRRVKAIAVKEFIHVVRDPRSLGMAIALPVLLLVIFGYALTLDVNNVPMVVWNQDKSRVSEDFLLNFKNSRYFDVTAYYDNYRQIDDCFDRGKATMAMVIHRDFSKYVRSGGEAPVQLIVDGSDSNTAMISMGYVSSVVARYNLGLMNERLAVMGIKEVMPVDVRPRIWFNADLKSRNFIIPGLIAIILSIISALLTSLTVAKEWEKGTMEQLISTPVKGGEIILGKFIPYFAIGYVDLAIAVLMGLFVFQVPFRGNIFLLFALSGVFLTGVLMLGMQVSIGLKNQLLASQIALISTFVPAFILSGFMYPIASMPQAVQVITHIVPARYFIVILKGIFLKGVGMAALWTQALFLVIFAALMIAIANKKFKKRVT